MFFTSSVFLKSPKRVAALAMVMGLCLLIYALGEGALREALAQGGRRSGTREASLPESQRSAVGVPAISGGAPAQSGRSATDLEPHRGTKIALELPGPGVSAILSALLKEGAERECKRIATVGFPTAKAIVNSRVASADPPHPMIRSAIQCEA